MIERNDNKWHVLFDKEFEDEDDSESEDEFDPAEIAIWYNGNDNYSDLSFGWDGPEKIIISNMYEIGIDIPDEVALKIAEHIANLFNVNGVTPENSEEYFWKYLIEGIS